MRTWKIALLPLALLLCGTVATPAADVKTPPAKEEVRKDRFDDPLPADALSRLGTIRWRQGSPITLLSFLPGNKQVLTAGADQVIRLWDADTGRLVRSFNASGQSTPMETGGVPEWMYNPGQQWVVVSADGKLVATASQRDLRVRVWDVSNGKMLKEVAGLTNGLTSLTFTPDGKQIAACSYDSSITLIDAEAGKIARVWNKPDAQNRVWYGGMNGSAFSPDGKTLVTIGNDLENQQVFPALKMWDVANGKLLHSIRNAQGTYGFYTPTFAPDGKVLAWGTSDGSVRLLDPATGKETKKLQPGVRRGGMMQLTFGPDGKKLYTKSYGEAGFREFDVASGKEDRTLGDVTYRVPRNYYYNQNAITMSVSRDAKRIIGVGGNNAVYMVDLTTGKEVPITTAGHDNAVLDVQYVDGGKTLVTKGLDGTVRRWETATGKELGQIKLPAQAQNMPSYMSTISPDGKTLAASNYNGTVQIFDLASGKTQTATIDQQGRGGMVRLAFSPDSKLLAARSQMGSQVVLLSVATAKEVRKLVPVTDNSPNPNYYYGNQWQFMLFSGDGKYLAASGANQDNSVRIWQVSNGNEQRHLNFAQGQFVMGGTFSPDARTVALEMNDTTVGVWEVQTGKQRRKFGQAPQNLIPNGYYNPYGIVTGSSLVYSADGSLLALAGKDRKVRLWEMTTGKELGTFEGHEGSILALAFAPDGKTLTTTGSDTTALVWDVTRRDKNRTAQTGTLSQEDLEARWKLLDATDSSQVAEALAALWTAPKSSLPFLAERVKPAPPTEVDRVEQLIRDLDSPRFVVRRKALQELERMGDVASPQLKKTLTGNPSVEVKKRVTDLLERVLIRSLTAEELRSLRVVELLETINTPQARELLQQLAKGAPSALLTVEAQTALSRMK